MEVFKPTPVPCVSASDLPVPPTSTELKAGMTFKQREGAVWIDVEKLQDYANKADAVLRGCVEKK